MECILPPWQGTVCPANISGRPLIIWGEAWWNFSPGFFFLRKPTVSIYLNEPPVSIFFLSESLRFQSFFFSTSLLFQLIFFLSESLWSNFFSWRTSCYRFFLETFRLSPHPQMINCRPLINRSGGSLGIFIQMLNFFDAKTDCKFEVAYLLIQLANSLYNFCVTSMPA